MAEHLTVNQDGVGSNPTEGANLRMGSAKKSHFIGRGAGSNPA